MQKSRNYIIKAFEAVLIALLMQMGMPCIAQQLRYPEEWTRPLAEVRPLYCRDTLTLCFVGDVMMHSAQIADACRKGGGYDFSSYFRLMSDRIEDADIAVANLEFTLAGEPYTGYPSFSAPDTIAAHLARTGFDVFLAANNHIYDKGSAGASRTLAEYRRLEDLYGIAFTGLAEDEKARNRNTPLIIRHKGIRIALVNFTYGTNCGISSAWPRTTYEGEKTFLAEAFARAEEARCDIRIALPHWGTEYVLEHSEKQERTAVWLAENGADLIIGTHPHVIQDCGEVCGVPVAYSLGNVVSNMSAKDTQMGLMATVRIVRHGNGDIEMLPPGFTYLWCSRPGGFGEGYTVVPVKDYIGRPDEWRNRLDYEKMMSTYGRIREKTGIEDR